MLPKEPIRHHRVKKIILGIIIVPIALFIMLIIVSFIMSIFYKSKIIQEGNYKALNENTISTTTKQNIYDIKKQTLMEGLGNQSLGAKEPKLTIVEFADFACPYCKASASDLRKVVDLYKEKVKLVFRDWPGHDNSVSLAIAAYCAGEQNKFWEMHDLLYQNQSTTFGADKNDLALLANNLGVYNEKFQSCFDNQKYLYRIQKNITDGDTLQVKGTPTWFFNGDRVEGQLNKQDLEDIIKTYVTQ